MAAADTLSIGEKLRQYYPKDAGASTSVEFPEELVTREQPPPPNPLLALSYEQMGTAGPIRAEPASVHVALCQGDEEPVLQTLRLINASPSPQRIHILHPETPYFSMSIGPNGEGKRGTIMPGMSEDIVVKCTPTDGLRYYRDNVKIHMPGNETMVVPLHAYPALAEAALPTRIDFGKVAQGQSTVRELPLRAGADVEFEFQVKVLQPHPDFALTPLEGVVPAGGAAAIVFTFTPSRMATASCIVEVHVAQLGWKPVQITLVGSSSAHQVRTATLSKLYSQGAHLPRAPANAWASHGGGAVGEGDAADTYALDDPSRATDVIDVADAAQPPPAPTDGQEGFVRLQSVLVQPPPKELLMAIAAQPLGGGSGGGDSVTRAQALQLRAANGGQSVPVRLPIERPPFEEGSKDGLRVPPDLSNQAAVNTMLTSQRNKMRITDLRAAIERQQVAAEKQQEEIEAAAMEALSVDDQLQAAFTSRVHNIIKHLQETDVTGSGFVTRAAFQARGVRMILRVPSATAEDVGKLFDTIDTQMTGKVGYAQFERVARRAANKKSGQHQEQRMEAAELDQALHGPERTRQLKELIFSREVSGIEDYEKQKEVKSFVAIGQPLVEPYVVEATIAARAQHADEKGRAERSAIGARIATDRLPERVLVAESVVAEAADSKPSFDPYLNETWSKREAVLLQFQQGVRIATIRTRVDRRIKALQASLKRAGISLTDKAAVRQLVVSRTKGGAGVPPSTADPAGGAAAASAQGGSAHGLTPAMLAHFTFPEPPEKGAQPRDEPIAVAPIEAFDETRLFALRVPRRYVQMEYKNVSLTAPGAFPPVEGSRELRVGAAFEAGRPLPSGTPDPVPDTWGLPMLLLQPPPQPLTPSAMESALAAANMMGTKAIGEGDGGDDGAEDAKAKPVEEQPPVLPKLAPKVMSVPPDRVEMSTRQMLRPMPIACNEFWRFEPIGWGSAITTLEMSTLAKKWRATHEPWADALVAVPAELSGVVVADVAEELSEDESDTEIDPSLRFPPSLAKLGEIFDLPAIATAGAPASEPPADGDATPPPAAEPAETEDAQPPPTAAAAAADAVDDGDVAIAPELSLPVDVLSECARAQAALGEAAAVERREKRLKLREAYGTLNELIDKPRFQLSLT